MWAVTLALAACGEVSNKSPDAGSHDGPASIDAALVDASGSASIVRAHHVFDMQRADQVLPVPFTTTSGRAVIIAAGSGQCASGFAIGMSIKLDGTSIGSSRSATNELNSSKAFVRTAIPVDLIAGTHNLTVEPLAGTTMGASDFVDVMVIELGTNATATSIFQDVAPPYSATFTAGGGHGVLLAGASGYVAGTAATTIGVNIQLDTQPIGQLKTYSNEVYSHKSFGAVHMVLTPGAGSRMLDLVGFQGTAVDYNDRASALWLELGSDVTPAQVMDHGPGPLPLSNTFVSSGGPIIVFVEGSSYASTSGILETSVKLDSMVIGSAKVVTAEASSHKTLVPTVLLAQPAAGMHTLALTAATGTNTDFNDSFNVSVIEL